MTHQDTTLMGYTIQEIISLAEKAEILDRIKSAGILDKIMKELRLIEAMADLKLVEDEAVRLRKKIENLRIKRVTG